MIEAIKAAAKSGTPTRKSVADAVNNAELQGDHHDGEVRPER